MVLMQNFEIMSYSFQIVGIYTSEHSALKVSTKLYNY